MEFPRGCCRCTVWFGFFGMFITSQVAFQDSQEDSLLLLARKCTMRCSCIFVLSNFSRSNSRKEREGVAQAVSRGAFFFFFFFLFFFTCFSTPRSIKFALPVIVLYCIGRIMHVAYISRRKECTCGCTYLLSSKKMSREGDMFDFASLGTDNCLQRSSFCKGDGCNGNSYTMHFAQWNNCICIPFN